MTLALTSLAADLDGLAEDGNASIVETQHGVTVSGLSAGNALRVAKSFRDAAWTIDAEDEAGEPVVDDDGFDPDLGLFRLTGRKPESLSQRIILTKVGLRQALSEAEGAWQVVACKQSFATGLLQISPLGAEHVFSPASPLKSPHEVVRETGEPRRTPVDIRKWLLRSGTPDNVYSDPAFLIFAEVSASHLARSLCSECNNSDTLAFFGPPRAVLSVSDKQLFSELTEKGFKDLISAVAWVYEDPAATEQRHALLAAEVARSSARGESFAQVFLTAGADILQGARLAYQLSLSDLSREAIKAQGDLRKAIADDTTKASESTRSLSTAVAVSIATAITLIATRSTGAAKPWVISIVAAVVALYLAGIAITGWLHLRLQRKLREQWRHRFYNFVAADDYEAMVTIPARDAERPYHIVGVIAILVAILLGGTSLLSLIGPSFQDVTEQGALVRGDDKKEISTLNDKVGDSLINSGNQTSNEVPESVEHPSVDSKE